MKAITFGTVLEPKFDREFNSGHLVIRDVFPSMIADVMAYETFNLKTKEVVIMYREEIVHQYDILGQEDVGKVLFCGEEE